MKNSFQIIIIGILCFFSSIILFSQSNNDYKPILDNGYAWVSLGQPSSIAIDNRYNYLVSLLQSQYFKKHAKSNTGIIDCEKDIAVLNESLPNGNGIDLDFMVRMIDKFYTNKENLPIPILGAYCYCIKELAGSKKDNLEAYRKELLIIADKYSE
jgi:hypothetical protein